MRVRLLVLVFILGLVEFSSCGGSTQSQIRSDNGFTGSVTVFGGDAPLCNVMSFSVTLTGATLTPQNGGMPVSVISSSMPVTVDFAGLMGFSTVLNMMKVPPATYSQVTLTMSNPQMAVLNSSTTPMTPQVMNATLTSSTVTVNINPALAVASQGSMGLNLDFDLLQSVQTASDGSVTGTVNPIFHATPIAGTPGSMMGEMDGLHGIVQSVSTSSSDSSFTGSFVLQQGMMGRSFTAYVTGSTTFNGATGLSALTAGAFVEVDANVDANGNIVAKSVEVEDLTEMAQNMGAFVGAVTSVTRDAQGNATQCTLAVREEYPNMQSMMPMMSNPIVNISSTTQFKISNQQANFAQLQFGPSTLGIGQNVIVNGQINMGMGMMGSTAQLTANSIVLSLQAVPGNFSKILAAGSDGVTGGFSIVPCSSLFLGQLVSALTFAQTTFSGVSGLNALTPSPTLVVKGLLFYEPTLTTVGTVPLTPPGMVLVSKEVEQLP